MLIRCWGARGSIPVSGKNYQKFGGDSPCIEVRDRRGVCLIIDCGTGMRRLGMRIMEEGRQELALVMTHFHWDHVLGFPFFRPLYRASTRMTLYGWPKVQGDVQEKLFHVMAPPHFPVPARDISAQISTVACHTPELDLGELHISTIPLNHPNQGLGFRITEQGRSFVFLTDNELDETYANGSSYAAFVEFCRGADLLVHDGEYTEKDYEQTRTWGHSRYVDAVRLAMDAGVDRLGLFHHNQDRMDDEIETIVRECRQILADQGSPIDCFAVAQDMQWELE
ncbi:MBL fold metallo-hydrolase [Desulfoplanes sp.]